MSNANPILSAKAVKSVQGVLASLNQHVRGIQAPIAPLGIMPPAREAKP